MEKNQDKLVSILILWFRQFENYSILFFFSLSFRSFQHITSVHITAVMLGYCSGMTHSELLECPMSTGTVRHRNCPMPWANVIAHILNFLFRCFTISIRIFGFLFLVKIFSLSDSVEHMHDFERFYTPRMKE